MQHVNSGQPAFSASGLSGWFARFGVDVQGDQRLDLGGILGAPCLLESGCRREIVDPLTRPDA